MAECGRTKAETGFEEYRENLHSELMRLAGWVRIHRRLHERRQDRLDEMNTAPAFFQGVTDALFSAIVLWVDKLYNPRSERGMHDFLRFVEGHLSLFSVAALKERRAYPDDHWMLRPENRQVITKESIRADKNRLKGLTWLRSIKKRRDKFHAHFDAQYFFDRSSISKEAPLTWADLDEAVKVATEVLNTYSAAYDGKILISEPVNAADVDYLLNELHALRQRQPLKP